MKIRFLLLTVVCLAVSSIGLAQSKTAAVAPEAVVKNLYAAQKSKVGFPFFQAKSRVAVDKFFTKEFADAIWKDTLASQQEIAAIAFDPLYYTQDAEITGLIITRDKGLGGADNAFVTAAFKNHGTAATVRYELLRDADVWKINDIFYSDGESLSSLLRYEQNADARAEFEQITFKGGYMVGANKCKVTPTKGGMYFRVECSGQKFKLYSLEGSETETSYILPDEKSGKQSKFVFKNGAMSGEFVDLTGKKVKVTPIKETAENDSDSEYTTVKGELEVGKTNSLILYVGEETGDYAAYCFANNSQVGKAILAKCKNGGQCEFTGSTEPGECKVPGLEATLSDSGKITKVNSVKAVAGKKN